MTFLHLITLGIIQGITEFLPISSSAHLILVPKFLGEADQGLVIDLAAHLGTLLAVMILFYRDVGRMALGGIDTLRGRKTDDAKLLWLMVLGTIPVGLVGILVSDLQEVWLRDMRVIAFTSVVFGAALWWADRKGAAEKTVEKDLNWRTVLYVGASQILALVPGTSRSGITMTTARQLGFSRVEAARFSFLLSIPVTAVAALLGVVELLQSPEEQKDIAAFFIVAGISFVTAILAIIFLLRWLKNSSFTPFVLYRFALAAVLVIWFV